jgi:hypothetical protein
VLIASTVRRKPIEVWMLASFGFESLWRDVQRGKIICRWSTDVQRHSIELECDQDALAKEWPTKENATDAGNESQWSIEGLKCDIEIRGS